MGLVAPSDIQIDSSGGTISLSVQSIITYYYFYTSSTVDLQSNLTVNESGTPTKGQLFEIKYRGDVDLSVHNTKMFFFGLSIGPDASDDLPVEFARKQFSLEAYYNGSSFEVKVFFDFQEDQILAEKHLRSQSVSNAKIKQKTIANDRLVSPGTGFIKATDSNGDIVDVSVSNGYLITFDSGTSNIKSVQAAQDLNMDKDGNFTIQNNAVTTSKIQDKHVTKTKLEQSVQDTLDGLDLHFVKIRLEPSAVKGLNSSPQTLLTGQGFNKVIAPFLVMYRIKFDTTAYDTNTKLEVKSENGTQNIFEGDVLGATTAQIGYLQQLSPPGNTDTQLAINDQLLLTNTSGDPATGDSMVEVYLLYKVYDVS